MWICNYYPTPARMPLHYSLQNLSWRGKTHLKITKGINSRAVNKIVCSRSSKMFLIYPGILRCNFSPIFMIFSSTLASQQWTTTHFWTIKIWICFHLIKAPTMCGCRNNNNWEINKNRFLTVTRAYSLCSAWRWGNIDMRINSSNGSCWIHANVKHIFYASHSTNSCFVFTSMGNDATQTWPTLAIEREEIYRSFVVSTKNLSSVSSTLVQPRNSRRWVGFFDDLQLKKRRKSLFSDT